MKQKLALGFTLIELLVVISILGILMSIISVNLVTAQKQARDARRLQDMTNIQTAFESYFGEFSVYPTTYGDAFDGGAEPTDPKSSGTYVYNWTVNTSTYCICAKLETATGNASNLSCSWSTSGAYLCIQNKQ